MPDAAVAMAQPPAVVPANHQRKSTEATVFVRFIPPAVIHRHVLEEFFSEIGPVKKSAVVKSGGGGTKGVSQDASGKAAPDSTSSYAFVRFAHAADAAKAAKQLNGRMITSLDTPVKLRVEQASAAKQHHNPQQDGTTSKAGSSSTTTSPEATRGRQREEARGSREKSPKRKSDAEAISRDKSPKRKADSEAITLTDPSSTTEAMDESHHKNQNHKKSARLILRNLSFYAKESQIRKALEPFGTLEEVHIPTVTVNNKVQPRGFAFVTFTNRNDAQKCLDQAAAAAVSSSSSANNNFLICKRPVKVDWSLPREKYESTKPHAEKDEGNSPFQPPKRVKAEEEVEHHTDDVDEEEEEEAENDEDDNSDDDDDDSDGDSDKMDEDDDASSDDEEDQDQVDEDQDASGARDEANDSQIMADASEKRTLFIRNLPFDATRHDMFEVFRKFGHIDGIYLVKDKVTNMSKGTAFVVYKTQKAAQQAIDNAADTTAAFVPLRDAATTTTPVAATTTAAAPAGGIMLKGRPLLVSLAVDKDTAATLKRNDDHDKSTSTGKDKRFIYLKPEGRVEENWDDLPESDKLKRQTAWSDKITKLRSPVFFVNPKRLSIRNLAKHVDEVALKKLVVEATQSGLERKLVSIQDQIAYWRASGEMSTRDIIQKTLELEQQKGDTINTKKKDGTSSMLLPTFDTTNIKKYIPSVFISRDFESKAKKGDSRGFGFVEFEHHVHALACLRQLNNNLQYTEEYVVGGKQAMMGRFANSKKLKKKMKKRKDKGEDVESSALNLIPRLIVEFTVENKVKAKQQSEHRAAQQANKIKQKSEHSSSSGKQDEDKPKNTKRLGRGALQRERKRKARAMAELAVVDGKENPITEAMVTVPTKVCAESNNDTGSRKPKLVKPRKKQKIDKEDQNFEVLVDSYKRTLPPALDVATEAGVKQIDRRWFE